MDLFAQHMDKKIKQPTHSDWAVNENSVRLIYPKTLLQASERDPLSNDCYPIATGYYPLAQGHQMRRSKPSDNLLIYCVEGKGSVSIGNKKQTVKAGSLLILPSGVAHEYSADGDEPWTIYWLHFLGELSHLYLRRISNTLGVIDVGVHRTIISAFAKIIACDIFIDERPNHVIMSNHLKTLLIAIMTRQKTPSTHALKQKIDAYLARRLAHRIHMETMAKDFGMSAQRFRRTFKSIYNTTPTNYFNRLKLNRATLMLEQTAMSISDISAQIGLEDSLYFSRLFKKEFGCSPTEFRERS